MHHRSAARLKRFPTAARRTGTSCAITSAPGLLTRGIHVENRDHSHRKSPLQRPFAHTRVHSQSMLTGGLIPVHHRDPERGVDKGQRESVTRPLSNLHRAVDFVESGFVGEQRAVRYRERVLVGDDGEKWNIVSVPRATAVASSKSSRHPRRPRDDRATPRQASAIANGDPRIRLPFAGSPAARLMIRCDHRSMSRGSPVSCFKTIAGNDSPTRNVGSPIVSSSSMCSCARREASGNRAAIVCSITSRRRQCAAVVPAVIHASIVSPLVRHVWHIATRTLPDPFPQTEEPPSTAFTICTPIDTRLKPVTLYNSRRSERRTRGRVSGILPTDRVNGPRHGMASAHYICPS